MLDKETRMIVTLIGFALGGFIGYYFLNLTLEHLVKGYALLTTGYLFCYIHDKIK